MRFLKNVAFASAAAALLALPVQAANVYNITQNQSQLNLTAGGTVVGANLTVTEQQANAITRYNGTVGVGFTSGPNPGSSINFPSASAAAAVNPTGGFLNQPLQYAPGVNGVAGTAAGNYGLKIVAALDEPYVIGEVEIPVGESTLPLNLGTLTGFNMDVAVRNLVLNVNGSNTPIGPGGTFDANATSLSVVSGFVDIKGSLILQQSSSLSAILLSLAINAAITQYPELGMLTASSSGSNVLLGVGTRVDLTGTGGELPNLAAADGTVSFGDEFTQSTLLLPVAFNLPLDDLGLPEGILDLQLEMAGQLRATGLITEVPEPSSLALCAIAASGIALVIRRRRSA